MNLGIFIAGAALTAAAILYFVFLPHIEGPPLDQQRADKREMLVCCEKCSVWQMAEPVASTLNEPDKQDEGTETNWFRCRQCNHRWSEKQLR
ncbi:MAG: hypothetical protein AB8G95_07155 [Anaerolineae bacterium]